MSEKRNQCDDEIKQLELQEHEECVFRGVDFADRRRERFDDRRVIDKHDARLRQFGGHLRDLFGSGLARQKVEREDPRVFREFRLDGLERTRDFERNERVGDEVEHGGRFASLFGFIYF